MGKVWVILKGPYRTVNVNNITELKTVGDWVQVSKQEAQKLLKNGQAKLPDVEYNRKVLRSDLSDCGVLVHNGEPEKADYLRKKYGIAVDDGEIRLQWARTLLWNTATALAEQRVLIGFMQVEKRKGYDAWECAAILRGNEWLAEGIGSDVEKQKTLEVVGDLRLPVYNTDVLWVRRTDNTSKLIDAWKAELEQGADPDHAFLRALYANPVAMQTLPPHWLYPWANP